MGAEAGGHDNPSLTCTLTCAGTTSQPALIQTTSQPSSTGARPLHTSVSRSKQTESPSQEISSAVCIPKAKSVIVQQNMPKSVIVRISIQKCQNLERSGHNRFYHQPDSISRDFVVQLVQAPNL
jgi:hypothetical protein